MQYTETSIYDYMKQGIQKNLDKIAIWFNDKAITYRKLLSSIDTFSDKLFSLGVREDTVVTIHLPNCPQAVIAIYAIGKLGGICNLLHPAAPIEVLRQSALFTESKIIISSNQETQRITETTNLLVRFDKLDSFSDLLSERKEQGFYPEQDSLGQKCAVYLHSSGTTGQAKTIMLSHRTLNCWVENMKAFFHKEDPSKQVALGVLPISHALGFALDLHRNMSYGGTLVMVPRWDCKLCVELIKRYHITVLSGVPIIFYKLLQEAAFSGPEISQIKDCFVSGDNVDESLITDFNNRIDGEIHMFAGYGLTEALAHCVNSREFYRIGSVGKPLKGTVFGILQEDGSIAFSGRGELVISNDSLMMGYLKDPVATKHTLFSWGERSWIRTGDFGEIDTDGYVFFLERIKNIIVHNGFNVFPNEVEEVISSVPVVREVCVIGRKQEDTKSENVIAFVVLSENDDTEQAKARIMKECRRSLPRFAIPKEIYFLPVLPRNTVGKIDRKELRNARTENI